MSHEKEIKDFYKKSFPVKSIWTLFTARNAHMPERREFACELSNDKTKRTVWKRHIPCPSMRSLQDVVEGHSFHALHIGPCFSDSAQRVGVAQTQVVGKELVFDLDLQDFAWFGVSKDDQLSNDRHVKAVFAACAVLVEILKETMDFKEFVAVYSGRRGVHLWVLDERAFFWTDREREALCKMIGGIPSKTDPRVVETFNILNNPSFGKSTWHALDEAHQILIASEKDGGVGIFDTQSDVDKFIDKLFDVSVQDRFSSAQNHLKKYVMMMTNTKTGEAAFDALELAVSKNKFYANRLEDVMLSISWPTIDVGATSKTKHMTKSIFSIHAATGRVAVPVPLDCLFSTKNNILPPVVTPREVGVDGTDSKRHFEVGKQVLDQAIGALTKPAEDLNMAKRARLL